MAIKEIRICDRCGTEKGVTPRYRTVGSSQDEAGKSHADEFQLDLCDVCVEALKNEASFVVAEGINAQRGFTEKQALDVLWIHLALFPRHNAD